MPGNSQTRREAHPQSRTPIWDSVGQKGLSWAMVGDLVVARTRAFARTDSRIALMTCHAEEAQRMRSTRGASLGGVLISEEIPSVFQGATKGELLRYLY